MTLEIPLQYDLFTGEKVDTRTSSQRKADGERNQLQQMEMFKQREIAQFGVRAHPQMSLSPHTKLVLIREDPRTEEEIERDRMKEAEANTHQLFTEAEPHPVPPESLPVFPITQQVIFTISQSELLACRPDFAEQINRLDQSAVMEIAQMLHDALQPSFRCALWLMLDWYFYSQAVSQNARPVQ